MGPKQVTPRGKRVDQLPDLFGRSVQRAFMDVLDVHPGLRSMTPNAEISGKVQLTTRLCATPTAVSWRRAVSPSQSGAQLYGESGRPISQW